MTDILWRYLTFDKFLDLLSTSEIHLSSPDSFDDPWEFVAPSAFCTPEHWLNKLEGVELPAGLGTRIQRARAIASFFASSSFRKHEYAVSCWTGSDRENAGFWEQYTGRKSTTGVAVVSSRSALRGISDKCTLHDVEYVDFSQPDFGLGALPLRSPHYFLGQYKRVEFSHENEVRLIAWRAFHSIDRHLRIKISLPTVVQRFVVCPNASEAFYKVISDLCGQYLSGVTAEHSALRFKQLEDEAIVDEFKKAVELGAKIRSESYGYKIFARESEARDWLKGVNSRLSPLWIGRRASDGLPVLEPTTTDWAVPMHHPSDDRVAVVVTRSLVSEFEKIYTPEECRSLGWDF